MNPKFFVIILTYNGKDDTIECLNSVKKIDYDNYEIVVVDNASTDGTVETLRKKFPKVKIIENEKNFGYGKGNNIGIEYSAKQGYDYVLILNNDTIVDKNLLKEMVKTYENNRRVGMVGVMELNYYKPKLIESVGGEIEWLNVGRHAIGAGEIDNGQYGKEFEVNFVSGVGFLISKEVIDKVGMFDPIFVTYFDDTDLCYRICKKGYKLLVNPNAKIWHKVSKTTKKIPDYVLYYGTRNKFLFMKKNATKKDFWRFIRFFFVRVFPRQIKKFLLEKEVKNLVTYLKAVLNGVLFIIFKVRKV